MGLFSVDVDLHHRYDDTLSAKIDHLLTEVKRMGAELDRLTAEVEKNTAVDQGAITLLNNLSELIRNNVNDPAALNKLADDMQTSSQALADAVVANTPAAE